MEFLHKLLAQKNAGRQKRLAEERSELSRLPRRRLKSYKRVKVQVNQGSLIRVQKNVYSVHSRLIGEQVEARVYADTRSMWRFGTLKSALRHCLDSAERNVTASTIVI